MQTMQLFNNKYKYLSTIQVHTYFRLYEVEHVKSNKTYFIKECNLLNKGNEDLELEITYLKDLNHKYFFRFVEIYKENKKVFYVYEAINAISLEQYLIQNGTMNVSDVVSIGKQICQATMYLKERFGLKCCGNLSIYNVFIENKSIKLLDISAAVENKLEKSLCITHFEKGYSAREIAQRMGDSFSDVYSIAMIMYTLLSGVNASKREISNNDFESLQLKSNELIEILKNSCKKDPQERYVDTHILYQKLNSLKRKSIHCSPIVIGVLSVLLFFNGILCLNISKNLKVKEYFELVNTVTEFPMNDLTDGKEAIEMFPDKIEGYKKVANTYTRIGNITLQESIALIEELKQNVKLTDENSNEYQNINTLVIYAYLNNIENKESWFEKLDQIYPYLLQNEDIYCSTLLNMIDAYHHEDIKEEKYRNIYRTMQSFIKKEDYENSYELLTSLYGMASYMNENLDYMNWLNKQNVDIGNDIKASLAILENCNFNELEYKNLKRKAIQCFNQCLYVVETKDMEERGAITYE